MKYRASLWIAVVLLGCAPKERPIRVAIDETHDNKHTVHGSYAPLAELIDGPDRRIMRFDGPFDSTDLGRFDALVVAGVPAEVTFTSEEIEALANWVDGGGSLLLVADHWPYVTAIADLAAPYGFAVLNMTTYDAADALTFGFTELGTHEITAGLDAVWVFAGAPIELPAEATSLLPCDGKYAVDERGFGRLELDGFSMGAVRDYGSGRVAMLGEAGMISCQDDEDSGEPYGFCAAGAEDNEAFTVNLFDWLLH